MSIRNKYICSAKLEMLQTKEYFSPYYWGAFVMYGE
jgi:CHAT domain-containing protein